MAVTRQEKSVQMTATGDSVSFVDVATIVGMTFQGSGLTASQRLQVTEGTAGTGSRLADYITEAATDNAELWAGKPPKRVMDISITSGTLSGTWVLTIFLL